MRATDINRRRCNICTALTTRPTICRSCEGDVALTGGAWVRCPKRHVMVWSEYARPGAVSP